jgi:hypothetical protein
LEQKSRQVIAVFLELESGDINALETKVRMNVINWQRPWFWACTIHQLLLPNILIMKDFRNPGLIQFL